MPGTRDDPMDVDAFNSNFNFNFNADHALLPPSNPVSRRRRITRNVLLSDGEIVEYSTEEEVLENRPQQNTLSSPSHQNQFVASSSHSQIMPSNFRSAPLMNNAAESRTSPITPHKRPHRGIRRHEFGDGEVFYLSTDDESVDERPPQRQGKHPRLGGALLKKSQDGIIPLVRQAPVLQTSQLPPALLPQPQGHTPVISQWSSLSNWNNPLQPSAQSSSPVNPSSSSPWGQPAQAVPRSSFGGIQTAWGGPSTSRPSPWQPYITQNRFPPGLPTSRPSMSPQRYPVQPPGVVSENPNLAHVNQSPFGVGMPGGFPDMDAQVPPVFGYDGQLVPQGIPGRKYIWSLRL